MYDLPELRADHDRLWKTLHSRLVAAGIDDIAAALVPTSNPLHTWLDSNLFLSQTCGYPLVSRLLDCVRVVATPGYQMEGCQGLRYRSWLVTRSGERGASINDFHRRRVVINEPDSLSGCKVLEMLLPKGDTLATFFSHVTESGSHVSSLATLAQGQADFAAIDCVTWGLLERFRPTLLAGLRIVDAGPSLPALPFITSRLTTDGELAALRTAFEDALDAPSFAVSRERLAIREITFQDPASYTEINERLSNA
jgi:ABC-type phosphate/phosphonate transport system substrate-binding protein